MIPEEDSLSRYFISSFRGSILKITRTSTMGARCQTSNVSTMASTPHGRHHHGHAGLLARLLFQALFLGSCESPLPPPPPRLPSCLTMTPSKSTKMIFCGVAPRSTWGFRRRRCC